MRANRERISHSACQATNPTVELAPLSTLLPGGKPNRGVTAYKAHVQKVAQIDSASLKKTDAQAYTEGCGNSRCLIARLFLQFHTIFEQQTNKLPIQSRLRLRLCHWLDHIEASRIQSKEF